MLKPLILNRSGLENTCPHRCRRFARSGIPQLVIRHCFNIALDINSIQERSADLRQITMHLAGSTGTGMGRVILPVMATRARVHGSNEHERSGICDLKTLFLQYTGYACQRRQRYQFIRRACRQGCCGSARNFG